MTKHVIVAGLVVIFCCGVLVAQEAIAVPPRVTAPVRAAALARAAQRTNAGPAAAAVGQVEAAQVEAEDEGVVADEGDETEKPERKPRRKNKGLKKAVVVGAVVVVVALVVVAVVDSNGFGGSVGPGFGF